MKFISGDGVRYLDRWEVGDSDVLGIANEHGDITAYVRRADGTRGHAFGGPVYDPPEFANACDQFHRHYEDHWTRWPDYVCDHRYDLAPAELAMATALAIKVGWLEPRS